MEMTEKTRAKLLDMRLKNLISPANYAATMHEFGGCDVLFVS